MNILIAGLLACGCVSLAEAPMWPPASDYINTSLKCSDSDNPAGCEATRARWTVDFDDATAGKHQAQETVARCLSTGCDGAIRIDAVLGCAWRRVSIDKTEAANNDGGSAELGQYCTRPYLDDAGQRAAATEAKSLQQMLDFK